MLMTHSHVLEYAPLEFRLEIDNNENYLLMEKYADPRRHIKFFSQGDSNIIRGEFFNAVSSLKLFYNYMIINDSFKELPSGNIRYRLTIKNPHVEIFQFTNDIHLYVLVRGNYAVLMTVTIPVVAETIGQIYYKFYGELSE